VTPLVAATVPVDAAPVGQLDRDQRLRELIARHYDFVWRSLRRFGVLAADAEDASQEVFLSAARRFDDIEPGCERGFLYRTAINHAAHAHRTRARRREVSGELLDEHPDAALDPEQLLDGAQARRLFYLVLDEIELEARAVFVLHELEQHTMAEIAQLLELPAGTVASRLRRARARFIEGARRATGERTLGGS
jgi:RNA polymerase sigma-70 factor, ECF subfamily